MENLNRHVGQRFQSDESEKRSRYESEHRRSLVNVVYPDIWDAGYGATEGVVWIRKQKNKDKLASGDEQLVPIGIPTLRFLSIKVVKYVVNSV